MQEQSFHTRIKNIHQMLFEMATGNLSFRINPQNCNDEITELETVLNMLAATMQNIFPKYGYVTPFYNYQNLVQFSLELDEYHNIKSFSEAAPTILNYTSADLVTFNFSEILVDQSLPIWNNIKAELITNEAYHESLQILFITQQKQIVSSFCTITRHLYSNTVLVCSVTTILQDLISDFGLIKPITPRESEFVIIQNVYEYIKEHLEEPLPTTKELAQLFGSNEFKLKERFRHFFNTSIYQFYNDERLKRAHYLIEQSSVPLKEIAFMCGFNDYTNFYKAFRKKYKYVPSDIKRSL